MKIIPYIADPSNFRVGRGGKRPVYIVWHYTANNGDTALGNGSYFAHNNGLKASAHYFCDESETVVQSVRDLDTAFAVGADKYVHPFCRNENSISIELCSKIDSGGKYYIPQNTVENALELTRALMKLYGIPAEKVIRHYDVTGKICPRPYVEHPEIWQNIKGVLAGKSIEKPLTFDEMKRILIVEVGLSPETVQYMSNYQYGEEMFRKIIKWGRGKA
jgi:N-acetylmuramoyl-L-alanine amidase